MAPGSGGIIVTADLVTIPGPVVGILPSLDPLLDICGDAVQETELPLCWVEGFNMADFIAVISLASSNTLEESSLIILVISGPPADV